MIVDEFIEKPKILSLFATQRIHWANFLALLHLLLIKHGEKKFHMVSKGEKYSKNLCGLADKLELKWKVVKGTQLFEYQKQVDALEESKISQVNVSVPQIIMDAFGNKINGKSAEGIVIAKDENALDDLDGLVLSHSNVGKILEYSDCCVNWFVNNISSGWEEVYAYLMEQCAIRTYTPIKDVIEMMEQNHEMDNVHQSRERINKIFVNHIAESRNTMPFIFFQPCDVCIGPSSPARKLNEKYANFAKENYPQLYKIIIDEGKKDVKNYE
jgi:hypothetical protein